jgi:hypothetical protein
MVSGEGRRGEVLVAGQSGFHRGKRDGERRGRVCGSDDR